MLKRFYQFTIVALLSVSLAACGGGNTDSAKTGTETETESTENTETETKAAEEETAAEETEKEATEEMTADAEMELKAVGETMSEIAYEPATMKAEAYTNLKINFKNMATTEGMNHNAVIIPKDDAIADEIRQAGMKAGGPNFDPVDDRIVAKSEMLLPGEETSFTFETPAPGEYYIICTYPGHTAMVATFVVE